MAEHPIKTKIIALSKLLREYEPIIVNEKFEGRYRKIGSEDDGQGIEYLLNNRNRLIQTSGEVMKELVEFIQDHKKLKTDYRELYVDGVEAHIILQNNGINSKSLAQAVEVLCGRIRQCYDVLHHIAHNLPTDAARFLAPLVASPKNPEGFNGPASHPDDSEPTPPSPSDSSE